MVELAVATGKYPNIVASDAALRKVRREIAAVVSGERRSKLLILGDSTQVGDGSGSGSRYGGAKARNPAAVMASLLTSCGVPSRADAWIGNTNILSPSNTAQYTSYNPNVVFGANWAPDAGSSLGNSMFSVASPNTDALEFTPEKAADRFDILYPRGSGFATFTITDTGGTLATIDSSGANAMILATATRGAASTTKIAMQRSSGGKAYANGMIPWNSTLAEMLVISGSAGGWRASNYIDTANFYSAYYGIAAVAANLHYIELGLNEVANAVSLATYLANLTTLIDYCVTISGAGSVILGISAPASGGYDLPLEWRTAIADLARTKDCVLVDHYSRFVSRAVDTSLYYDVVHLLAPGSAMKGGLMASLGSI